MNIKRILRTIRWNVVKGYFDRHIKEDSEILDIGAGDLYISKMMEDQFQSKVIGLDVKDYGTYHVEKVIVKDNKIKEMFPRKMFDTVTIICSLHHMYRKEQKEVLTEAKKIGKQIVILEDNKSIVSYIIDYVVNLFGENKGMKMPFSHRSLSEWLFLFHALGFTFEYKVVKRPFIYPLQHYVFTLKAR